MNLAHRPNVKNRRYNISKVSRNYLPDEKRRKYENDCVKPGRFRRRLEKRRRRRKENKRHTVGGKLSRETSRRWTSWEIMHGQGERKTEKYPGRCAAFHLAANPLATPYSFARRRWLLWPTSVSGNKWRHTAHAQQSSSSFIRTRRTP